MGRLKKFSDVRRLLLRHLYTEDRAKVEGLRDLVWDALITRAFMAGDSVETMTNRQPSRGSAYAIEAAIRREMRRRSVK